MLNMENTEQRGTGIENRQNSQMERPILIRPVQPRKVVHLQRWTTFFETFPSSLDQSINQFLTEISGNFG